MKPSHFIIVAFVVILASIAIGDVRINNLENMTENKIAYNRNVDNAVDAAVNNIVEVADQSDLQINLDSTADTFYRSLFANFGAADSESEQIQLSRYVPVIAIVENDGFYVQYKYVNGDTISTAWTPKLPYSYTSVIKGANPSDLISYAINFNLDNNVQIMIDGDSRVYSGDFRALKTKYASDLRTNQSSRFAMVLQKSIINSEANFVAWKRQIITDAIVKQLNYYVNKYNELADSFGISYQFSLPEGSESDISNNIDSVAFIALFQGYPSGIGTDDVYNQFCIGGAQISKRDLYYVQEGSDGILYYHSAGCKRYTKGVATGYKTREEAASLGALPCPSCKP